MKRKKLTSEELAALNARAAETLRILEERITYHEARLPDAARDQGAEERIAYHEAKLAEEVAHRRRPR